MSSSYTFTFTGNSSEMSSTFFPEIVLDEKAEYSCALLELTTYHSIPNVTESNNKFYFYTAKDGGNASSDENALLCISSVPVGSYEAEDILEYIKAILKQHNFSFEYIINKNTFKIIVLSSTALVIGDQYQDNILTKIFGFTNSKLIPNKKYMESEDIIKITSCMARFSCDRRKNT